MSDQIETIQPPVDPLEYFNEWKFGLSKTVDAAKQRPTGDAVNPQELQRERAAKDILSGLGTVEIMQKKPIGELSATEMVDFLKVMRTFAETAKKEAEEKIAKAGMSGIVTSEGIKWDILNKVGFSSMA
jgi:hypothetical protein